MKKNILPILIAATVVLPVLSQAQITNPGFESGTTGWTITAGDTGNTLGDFTTVTSLPGLSPNLTVNPTEGSQFGLISDALLNYSGFGDTETVSQTFTVNSTGILSLDYLFLTEAVNQPAYNPNAQITLTPTGGDPVTLASVSRNDLQADPADAGPLSPGAAYAVGGDPNDIGQDAWQTASFDVSSLVGQQVTLSFSVSQDAYPNDSFLNDQLAVDNIQIVPVPEPTADALLAGGFALLAILKLRSNNS
ncbi:MAG: hypothetical protein ABSF51_03430 [Verrucomicrobiota bacterium]|jgi:hypothetical protein